MSAEPEHRNTERKDAAGMPLERNGNYTHSALRIGDVDPYPQRRVGEFIGIVVSNEAVNDEYRHIIVEVHPHALRAYAGQMFHLLCPSPDGAEVWMRRPMSVYRVDRPSGRIEFLYKTEGRGTRGMAMLNPGDEFNVAGPLGVGFKLDPAWKNIVVLGRGVGLATLAPLSQLAAEHGVAVTAVLSARNPDVVMSRELFAGMGAHTLVVVDSDKSSAVENVERILEDLIARGKADAFFTCGSNRLLKLMQRLGKKHEIPGQVAMEQIMVCGFGACYVCVRTFEVDGKRVLKRVCRDGPVFNMQEAVAW
ncbi:MAG TPA: dihydroorotate dehydrogenase electron transfer subunit [Xanthobacteraceae bacterium]